MLRFVPGVLGAAAAFIVHKLLTLAGEINLGLQIVIFAAAYIVATVAADRAMKRYGIGRERSPR